MKRAVMALTFVLAGCGAKVLTPPDVEPDAAPADAPARLDGAPELGVAPAAPAPDAAEAPDAAAEPGTGACGELLRPCCTYPPGGRRCREGLLCMVTRCERFQ